jgi:hypothetical protein
VIAQYPSLRRLCVLDCVFKHVYAVSAADGIEDRRVRYQADELHTTLRGAPGLEYLEVTTDWLARMPAQTRFDLPIVMQSLKTAILPPPSLWRIDVIAPNLEALGFRLPAGYRLDAHEAVLREEQLPMIPDINDSPISEPSITTLQSAEFASCAQDDSRRLETWLSRLQNITRLGLHSVGKSPYPKPAVVFEQVEDRISYRIVGLLKDHPHYCPDMVELYLEGC